MILYLIIAPTLLKPEVWHELIRIVKIKWFKWFNVLHKDVDIEAVACVHNLQYKFSTSWVVHSKFWLLYLQATGCLKIWSLLNSRTNGLKCTVYASSYNRYWTRGRSRVPPSKATHGCLIYNSSITWCVKGKKGKGAYSSSWNSPQNYGTPLVKWDHTVLSATRQRWPPRLHPNRAGWYSIYRPRKDERLSWPFIYGRVGLYLHILVIHMWIKQEPYCL